MKKICFVGAPSTGKTVLAKILTEKLNQKGYIVEWAKEYARDFILERGLMKRIDDQLIILRGQKQREREAEEKNPEFIVCDCASFLSYVYGFLYKPLNKKDLAEYNQVLEKIWAETKDEVYSYDYVFFLPPEILPEEDGVRLYMNKRDEISNKIKEFLISQNIRHYEIKGKIKERIDQVLRIIFEKA